MFTVILNFKQQQDIWKSIFISLTSSSP